MQALKQIKVHLDDVSYLQFKVGQMHNGSWVKGIRVNDNGNVEVEYDGRSEFLEGFKISV